MIRASKKKTAFPRKVSTRLLKIKRAPIVRIVKSRRKQNRLHPVLRVLVKRLKPSITAIQPNALRNGINLVGFIRAEIGLGEGCRLMAKTIQAAEIPFVVLNCPGAENARQGELSWVHKEMNEPQYGINLFHINADYLPGAHHHFGHSLWHNRFNIGYWAWELTDFPNEWCGSFQLVHEVWVPSNFIRESVSKKSPVHVETIPHVIEIPPVESNRSAFGLPGDRYLFLCMYDTHSFHDRKNPQAAIEAFKLAFGQYDHSVGLVVKINNAHSNPEEIGRLREQIAGYPNIYLIDQIQGRHQVYQLLNSTDCFVSLHRSEGFGLGMAEMMYLGKPVIGTNWSGNTDFMNASNSCLVNFRLVRIGKDIGPYKAHQVWAEPDIEHAAHFMRRLVSDRAWGRHLAYMGKNTIRNDFSPGIIGKRVKERLVQLGL